MHTHGFTNMRKYMNFSQLLNSAQIRLIFESCTRIIVPFKMIWILSAIGRVVKFLYFHFSHSPLTGLYYSMWTVCNISQLLNSAYLRAEISQTTQQPHVFGDCIHNRRLLYELFTYAPRKRCIHTVSRIFENIWNSLNFLILHISVWYLKAALVSLSPRKRYQSFLRSDEWLHFIFLLLSLTPHWPILQHVKRL